MSEVLDQSELTEAHEMYERWTKLDDRTLAKNPISIRLPIQLLARLASLNDIASKRNRSELIIDLIDAGLSQFEKANPAYDPNITIIPTEDNTQPGFSSVVGELYRVNANKHYKRLAKEIGVENVGNLFKLKEAKHD